MSNRRAQICLLLTTIVFSSLSFGAQADRIQGSVFSGRRVALAGHVHHRALPQFDQGPVDPAMQMGTMTLLTVPTVAQRKALTQLVAAQQDPKSPSYHKWLTPEQWADRFGLSPNDVRQITNWLQAQGFTNIHPARGRNWVSFSGTAAQVQNALGTEIHHFLVNGEMHYANATPPAIPQAVAGIVTGFRGLHDFHPRAMGIRKNAAGRPLYDSSSFGQLAAPGDIATIYGINSLYSSGIDGTGQKLAVMGQTDIYLADLNDFRSGFGLATISTSDCTPDANGVISSTTSCNDPLFQYIAGGADPGVQSTTGDLMEADLDLEWAGAVARNAKIIYVNSRDTFTSYYYAVDNNVAPVISLSYGLCEFNDNNIMDPTTKNDGPDEVELKKANTEGITFVNASGDTGAAECDFGGSSGTLTTTNLATQGTAVSYPASSPEVTSVGGSATPLADFTSTYWGTTNGSDGGTALSYVPEQAWNDDYEFMQYCQSNPSNLFCSQGGKNPQTGWVKITSEATAQQDIGIASTGGGPSNCSLQTTALTSCVSGFAQPAWQTVKVSGQSAARFSPDISFFASPNFPGYIFCTPIDQLGSTGTSSSCASGIATSVDTYVSIIGGTSASTPVFAGIVTLLNQQTGGPNGNVNPLLYQIAAVAPSAFHDITSGDNKVYCSPGTPAAQPAALQCPSTGVLGFTAAAGFDLVTGLGSMDVGNFVAAAAAPPDFSGTADKSTLSVLAGQGGTTTITVTPVNNFTGSVSFACSGLPTGGSCSFSPSTVTPPGTTQTVATISGTTPTTSPATVSITATTGTLSQVSHSVGSLSLTVTQPFTVAATASSFQVAQGSSIDATVNLTFDTGFTGTVTFTCTDPATASVCTVPSPTNAAGQVSFHITTALPTAQLLPPLNRGSGILYAMLLPGLVGLALTMGSGKPSLRAMRFLGLIVALGFSTIWMASCSGGGSNGSTGNPGTPKGTYTISVTGTSGGATSTAKFDLVVQ
ncbi:MAG TPA: protease pro-enzyme activation domain-containing protein [Candidatus Sulfotelmatobacter sp.]|nr:protease pro-enzyme activation domain-containing protein [Candidatus Sulfotelmatobacter sp.]